MKILILGQSNSIGSYVVGLRAQFLAAKIINKSVGGSVGLQFAYYGNQSFSEYDFVIFENLANDEIYTRECGGISVFASVYVELLSTIASQTRLYILGFPSARHLNSPSEMYYLHMDIAEYVGATFVSMRDFILDRGPEIVCDDAMLMNDEMHPHQAISHQFGHLLGKMMKRHMARDNDQRARCKANSFAANFRRIALGDYSRGETVFRATKHIGRRFAVLRPREYIQLPFPIKPLGFYLDHGRTRAYLKLSGPRDEMIKRLSFGIGAKRPLLSFKPLRRRFEITGLEVVEQTDSFEDGLDAMDGDWSSEPTALISGIAGWTGEEKNWRFSGRGTSPTPFIPGRIQPDGVTVFGAQEMPAGNGWLPAARREDGVWSRLTGPESISTLILGPAPPKFRIKLCMLGGASAEAVLGLKFLTGGEVLETAVALDSENNYVAAAVLEPNSAYQTTIDLIVSGMRSGRGVEVSKLLIEPLR